jgi:hypothetical protein
VAARQRAGEARAGGDLGGTMRLGAFPPSKRGSKVAQIYGDDAKSRSATAIATK